ncbi:MAG: hypothetical protein EOM91_14810 [Sphingobacteriia bacterium]|nr:hypothetical protein [Sphingobacteriia bacterium]NCC40411.1 hypothetical protein [Gammaproteobacteria bacterium]
MKSLAGLVYLLQALSFVVGVTAILGVILNYARLRESRGTWLESHFIWQIRTFWYQLAWVLIGVLTSLFLVGLIILAVAYCWAIYRVAKGWLNLADDRPMYAEAP